MILALFMCLSACKKELVLGEASETSNPQNDQVGDQNNSQYQNALAEFRPYFERFETAANDRGLSFEAALAALETSLENISEEDVVGQCHWHSHEPELVTIDQPFWANASDLDREYVMFHELGHCVLFREHNNQENQNGYCLSLMASGTTGCLSAYNETNREYYLDELFGSLQ